MSVNQEAFKVGNCQSREIGNLSHGAIRPAEVPDFQGALLTIN